MIFTVILLIFGISILLTGIYYFVKEKGDSQSRKIYSVVTIIGIVICIKMIMKIL